MITRREKFTALTVAAIYVTGMLLWSIIDFESFTTWEYFSLWPALPIGFWVVLVLFYGRNNGDDTEQSNRHSWQVKRVTPPGVAHLAII